MMPASLFIAQSFSGLESTDELKLRNIYEHLKKYKNNFNEDIENFTNHDLIKNAAENIGFSLDYCATSLS